MAISEDTAALVAAQLTVAWATRAGVGTLNSAEPFESDVLRVYLKFKELAAERDLSKPKYDLRKLVD